MFSTLHTNDAPSAVTRLLDMGVKPFLVASALRAAMAQRLVRAICEKCKAEYTPTDRDLKMLGSMSKNSTLSTISKCPYHLDIPNLLKRNLSDFDSFWAKKMAAEP